MVRILSTAFFLQKGGNEPTEYEDSFYPAACGEHAAGRLSYAVADGATEGMLSSNWATLLVKLYKRRWLGLEAADDWLAHAYRDWQQFKTDYVRRREAEGHPIQWYEEPGLEAGAFSTILGVTFRSAESLNESENFKSPEEVVSPVIMTDTTQPMTPEAPTGEVELQSRPAILGGNIFETVALGDTCLFQIRDGIPVLQFPLKLSGEFNNRPLLISSNPTRNNQVLANFKSVRGEWRTGDQFYLMTDALASWSMREAEAGRAPWSLLQGLGTDAQAEPFAEWIATLRRTGQIRNDDVTCVRLQVM